MGRLKKQCPKCGLLDTLELERFDLSYKGKATTVAEPVITEIPELPKPRRTNDDRDKLMFNAGRFAAGATDKVAIDANRLLQIVLGEE
jgi:hypothetical protein